MTDVVVVCQFFSSVTVWSSTKHDGFGKRLCQSVKISYTVSCNISLYCDTKGMIYRYTQSVYRPISNLNSVSANSLLFSIEWCLARQSTWSSVLKIMRYVASTFSSKPSIDIVAYFKWWFLLSKCNIVNVSILTIFTFALAPIVSSISTTGCKKIAGNGQPDILPHMAKSYFAQGCYQFQYKCLTQKWSGPSSISNVFSHPEHKLWMLVSLRH